MSNTDVLYAIAEDYMNRIESTFQDYASPNVQVTATIYDDTEAYDSDELRITFAHTLVVRNVPVAFTVPHPEGEDVEIHVQAYVTVQVDSQQFMHHAYVNVSYLDDDRVMISYEGIESDEDAGRLAAQEPATIYSLSEIIEATTDDGQDMIDVVERQEHKVFGNQLMNLPLDNSLDHATVDFSMFAIGTNWSIYIQDEELKKYEDEWLNR